MPYQKKARLQSRRTDRRAIAVLFASVLCCVALPASEPEVSFNRDIAPIFATKCFECHGPDEGSREAGFRLDQELSATSKLSSGNTPIIPGQSDESHVVRRLMASGDERMPPPDSGDSLSAGEVARIRKWIDAGATWEDHWSFEPLQSMIPAVQQYDWPANPVDRFVLSQLEVNGLAPAPRADRYTLIRRLSFDLLGLPPGPAQVVRFVNDRRPDAYELLVDRMLASPRYGERWGRHWLDVARYADSNGGDENHAYPLAHKYRDYVIEAFNADVPFDEFIRQQLAGDLLPTTGDDRLDALQLTATGYLAIGMKILAEQDAVKKRADMVDEQLDTFGRTFLGLAIGCCRCHDHKFDTIPTRDYYALAGIFHSTKLADQPIRSREIEQRSMELDAEKHVIQQQIDAAQQELETIGPIGIMREAESFDRGNVVVDDTNYGLSIGIISDPGSQENFAEFDTASEAAGEFVLQLRYAAASARPGRILVNGEVAIEKAMTNQTGGWGPEHQRWLTQGQVKLVQGPNVLRIESSPMMSHIDKIRLVNKTGAESALLSEIDELTRKLSEIEKSKPSPTMVMGVQDGNVSNSRIHIRGSHLDLGDEVPRSFLTALDGDSNTISKDISGRLELANWLTDNDVASRLTSRVIVNRLWHWHFGRGLVGTPDDFGTRGESPTHPELLDFLAEELIERGWSLKWVNRLIVTSETYQMSSQPHKANAADAHAIAHAIDPTNKLYWKRNRVRLNAESIRDALLDHAGRMTEQIGDSPMSVKSQDPSPQDMQKNLEIYESSTRRSVYLPVVRSNIYEFFTLFDFPNASSPIGKRNETTIPTQALWLMNSPMMEKLARDIAAATAAEQNDANRIRALYLKLYSRPATNVEVERGLAFLASYRQTTADDRDGWAAFCQVLVSANEYLYLN